MMEDDVLKKFQGLCGLDQILKLWYYEIICSAMWIGK
jgi:hypothetical protein